MSRAWNELNPEWWKVQVETRGDLAWTWLVNEWVYATSVRCNEPSCADASEYRVTTAGGAIGFCADHAKWYLDKGPDIYPTERIAATIVASQSSNG